MVTTKIKPPELEIMIPTPYELLLHVIFDSIRNIRLCWFAEEELENKFPNAKINNELYFKKNKSKLEIRHIKSNRIVAVIYFDGAFNSITSNGN